MTEQSKIPLPETEDGKGKESSLFERASGEPVKLDPISSSNEGGMTVLRYALGD